MMNKLFNVSTMPLLGMVFLFMAACSDDADNSDPNNDIQNIEMHHLVLNLRLSAVS